MDQINTYEAKRNLSELLKRVRGGETIIIASHNRPIAELRPIREKKRDLRPVGLCAGQFVIPDNFNASLPDDILDDFEGL